MISTIRFNLIKKLLIKKLKRNYYYYHICILKSFYSIRSFYQNSIYFRFWSNNKQSIINIVYNFAITILGHILAKSQLIFYEHKI